MLNTHIRFSCFRVLTVLNIALILNGCVDVSPWERGNLAKTQMALDPMIEQTQLRLHIFESREAASGGHFGSGGGGCGCN